MNTSRWLFAIVALALLTLVAGIAMAQVSGRITGTVADPTGNVVNNAAITLTNVRTGEVLTVTTNESGAFVFPTVPPSSYTVLVKSQGYRTLERTGLILSANQTLALGYLQLDVGNVTETVTVTAGAAVELDTSGQNALVTDKQLGGLMSRGRDITAAFAAPGVGDFGNAPRDVFRGPGINNSDFTLFKNFPVREGMRFQFRWEMYNVFNHTQWAGVDNNARFDAAGNQVNGQFGQITSARLERQMQFALRFEF